MNPSVNNMPARAANWSTLSEEEKCERLKAQALRRQSSRGSQRLHGPRRYHRWDDLTEAQKCDVLRAKLRGEHDNVTIRKRKKAKHPPGERRTSHEIHAPEEDELEEDPEELDAAPDMEEILRMGQEREQRPAAEEIALLDERADDDDMPELVDGDAPVPPEVRARNPAYFDALDARAEPRPAPLVFDWGAPVPAEWYEVKAAPVVASMLNPSATTTFKQAIPRRVDMAGLLGRIKKATARIAQPSIPINGRAGLEALRKMNARMQNEYPLTARYLIDRKEIKNRLQAQETAPVNAPTFGERPPGHGVFDNIAQDPDNIPDPKFKRGLTTEELNRKADENMKKKIARDNAMFAKHGIKPYGELDEFELAYDAAVRRGEVPPTHTEFLESKSRAVKGLGDVGDSVMGEPQSVAEFKKAERKAMADFIEDDAPKPKKKAKKKVKIGPLRLNAHAENGSFGAVRIAPSNAIPGKNTGVGLWATRNIPKDFAITEYTGEWHLTPSKEPSYDVQVNDNGYPAYLSGYRLDFARNTTQSAIHWLQDFAEHPTAPKTYINWRGEEVPAHRLYRPKLWNHSIGQYANDARDDRNNAVIVVYKESDDGGELGLPNEEFPESKDYKPDFRDLPDDFIGPDDEDLHVLLQATRDIVAGEEIFVDYGYTKKDWEHYEKEATERALFEVNYVPWPPHDLQKKGKYSVKFKDIYRKKHPAWDFPYHSYAYSENYDKEMYYAWRDRANEPRDADYAPQPGGRVVQSGDYINGVRYRKV